MKKIRTVGVLTSGGDAPGMNAAVRAVVRAGIDKGFRVLGIKRGFNGLLTGDMSELNMRSVSHIINRGGTFLYTARCDEFKTDEGVKKGADICREHGIDSLIVIGGDGSFMGAARLAEHGISTIGIPATIDNDISCSDYSIGFDTACNIAMEACDRLRDTAQSHERCSIIEVMGRNAGHLALETGVASGAIAVLIPEKEPSYPSIAAKIMRGERSGKTHHIIIVSEGVGGGAMRVSEEISKLTGMETRVTVLGHVQRGGSPTVFDRVCATRMGYYAIEVLDRMKERRIVAIKNRELIDIDIFEGLQIKKSINDELYEIEQVVSK